jgi:hypothetical protein
MSVFGRISSGEWPSVGNLPAGLVQNGLVCAYDPGVFGDLRNLCVTPADGSSASTYDLTVGPFSAVFGTAGRKSASEYFRIAGGSTSTEGANTNNSYNNAGYAYMATSPTTFLNSLHKPGANWTSAFVSYVPPTFTDTPPVFSTGTSWGGTAAGVYVLAEADSGLRVGCPVSSGTFTDSHWKGPGQAKWNFQAVALSANVSLMTYANGALMELAGSNATSMTPNMTGNGADNSTQLRLGSVSNQYWSTCGFRIGQFFMWNRALSKVELDQCFEAVRRRWGI